MTEAQEAALMACYDEYVYRAAVRHSTEAAHEALWKSLPRGADGHVPIPVTEALRWGLVAAHQGHHEKERRASFLAALRSHMAGEAEEAAS